MRSARAIEINTRKRSAGPSRAEFLRLGIYLVVAIIVGVIAVIFATSDWAWGRAIGTAILVGLVGIASGAMAGFLFGIPRTSSVASPGTNKSTDASSEPQMKTNTNLEEISDWLTKIIVGIGLTQLYQLPVLFNNFRQLLASYFTTGLTPLICSLLLVFGFISGFMWLYLETRTVLTEVLDRYNRLLVGNLTNALSEIDSAISNDGTVLAPAAESLKAAAATSPDNEVLKRLTVKSLLAAGRMDEAKSMISNSRDVGGQIGRMLIALHQPNGYNDAIRISGELSGSDEARARPEYWIYLARAFGQKHHAILAGNGDPAALQSARDNALDAARRAVNLDAREKQRLYLLTNPDKSSSPNDGDLVDFRGDHDFKAVIGDPGNGQNQNP